MIPQEGIHERVRQVRDEIANHTNPQGVDAALAIRALGAGTITGPRKTLPKEVVGNLTDPQ